MLFVSLFLCLVALAQSSQFIRQEWSSNISGTFNHRSMESIALSKHDKNIAYITFTNGQLSNSAASLSQNLSFADRISQDPVLAKVRLREGEVLWSSPISQENERIRLIQVVVSPNDEVFTAGTLLSGVAIGRFAIQRFDVGGKSTRWFVSELAGMQVVHAVVSDGTGVYVCGRWSRKVKDVEKLQEKEEEGEDWQFLLTKVSYAGSSVWKFVKNEGDCKSVELAGGYVYTTGTNVTDTTISTVVYKHSKKGVLIWGRRIRSTVNLSVVPIDILARDENIFIASSFITNTPPPNRVYLHKVSERGTLLWSHEICCSSFGEHGYAMQGLGYTDGNIYAWIRKIGGVLVAVRVGRFGEIGGSEMSDGLVRLGEGVGVRLASVNKFSVVAVTSGGVDTDIFGFGVLKTEKDVIDSRSGRLKYKITFEVMTNRRNIPAIEDYLTERTRNGSITSTTKGEETLIEVVVRSDSKHTLDLHTDKLKKVFTRDDNGRSGIERDLGVVIRINTASFSVDGGVVGRGGWIALVFGFGVMVAGLFGIIGIVLWFWFRGSS